MSLIKNNNLQFFSLLAVVFFVCLPVYSQQYDLQTEMELNWETGDVTIMTKAAVPDDADNLTSERFRISEYVDRNLTDIALESFESLYLDSLLTVKTFLKNNQSGMTKFDRLNDSTEKLSSSFSRDLSSVQNIYRYNIYTDLMPILIDHGNSAPVPVVLDYEATAAFSGIVIYAADDMPLYGETETGKLKPAIFPKIFDENMNIAVSPKMSEPEFLSKWGFAVYTDTTDLIQFESRIGLYPFFTTAEAIFGNNRTDIIISEEAARKILYNKANRRLIREGRILIIYSAE
jgi:hypothetical protein